MTSLLWKVSPKGVPHPNFPVESFLLFIFVFINTHSLNSIKLTLEIMYSRSGVERGRVLNSNGLSGACWGLEISGDGKGRDFYLKYVRLHNFRRNEARRGRTPKQHFMKIKRAWACYSKKWCFLSARSWMKAFLSPASLCYQMSPSQMYATFSGFSEVKRKQNIPKSLV